MTADLGIGAPERSFQNIPADRVSEAEQTAFLMELSWHRGSNWADLLKSKRVLIISEAGAGKTFECQERQKMLWNEGEPAFFIELAELAQKALRDTLSPEEEARFDAWRVSQADMATFFLDSIDELKLTRGSFRSALTNLARSVAGNLARIRVVITSRPTPIDEKMFRDLLPVPDEPQEAPSGEAFAEIATSREYQRATKAQMAKDWRNVALLPLSSDHIRHIARQQGVEDPDALLADIQRRNAEEFVRRPQDLIELCADWRSHHRIRSHRDQVLADIAVKLKPRGEGREYAPLSPAKALEGARRLALASTLSRKLTVRHSSEADREGASAAAPLDPAIILHDWNDEERKTLLERPLFGFVSYGRVRFHHRSVIERLAAEQLIALRDRGMPIRAIKRLLFTTTAQGIPVVKPSYRPVAAWMALDDEAIFAEVLEREPDVLLNHGDPESLDLVQRQRALRAFVRRHRAGGWRGLRVPSIQLHRIAAEDLASEVQTLWDSGIENPEIREVLLELIGLGRMTDCADIAYRVAVCPGAQFGERIDALDALIRLNDPRLVEIGEAVAQKVDDWPDPLARSAVLRLFPAHLSVGSLLKALSRIKENKKTVGGMSWQLPRLIDQHAFDAGTLEALRQGLTAQVLEGLKWSETGWPRLKCRRPHVLPVLAATCIRLLQSRDFAPDVMWSAAITVILADRDQVHADSPKQLASILSGLPADARQRLFEAADSLFEVHNPTTDPIQRLARVAFHSDALRLRNSDIDWVIASLADPARSADKRAVYLEAALRIRGDDVEWTNHLASLRPHVADLPELISRLDQLAEPQKPDPEEERWRRESAKREKEEERRKAKARASWILFWREVSTDPDPLFNAERAENTAWNLWRAMERSGEESRASGWNRRFIEHQFGKIVADRLRIAMMAFWRKERPTLRSERPDGEKGTYFVSWQFGLAGIAAEAEDPQWAEKLNEDEAELALRYAPIELNGFPIWLESLSRAHSAAVDAVLGAELTAELFEQPSTHSGMLQDIKYAAPSVAALFLPRLRRWLGEGGWRGGPHIDESLRASRLRQVLQVFQQHGGDQDTAQLLAIAKSELADGVKDELNALWLPVLMSLEPAEGVAALEKTIRPHAPAKFGPPTDWFASLFGDRHGASDVRLLGPEFTPDLLLKLARLAYQFIRPEDDMVREAGSYSPNARDHAEQGRSNILAALLAAKGKEGWVAKLKMFEDPLFVDFRDRARALAIERASEEADTAVFTEAEIITLDKSYDLPAKTRDEAFIQMTDRLDDIEDILLRDDSPRAAWALIEDETIMRQQIARELRQIARSAYTVDQEAVTADGKETDIRLRSTGSEHEAVIELKIGDKPRSAAELKATIREQLVEKYMAAENARAGCLLITVNSQRIWKHPETNNNMNLEALIEMLNEEARQIEQKMGGSLRLIARGLDLRPRLPTERAKKARG